MLVLSRKKNESIIINDNITVTVIEIRGDKVRLGIEAPKDVTVHRREVYEAIQNQARALDQDAKVRRPKPELDRTSLADHVERCRPVSTRRSGLRTTSSPFRRESIWISAVACVRVAFSSRTNSRIQGPLSGQPRTVTSGPSTTTSRLTNSRAARRGCRARGRDSRSSSCP